MSDPYLCVIYCIVSLSYITLNIHHPYGFEILNLVSPTTFYTRFYHSSQYKQAILWVDSGQWSDTISQCRTTWPINMNISAGPGTLHSLLYKRREHGKLQILPIWSANVSFLLVMVSLWKIEGVDSFMYVLCRWIRPRYSYQGILKKVFEIFA